MQDIIVSLFWLGALTGGLLIILLLISIIGGMDFEADADVDGWGGHDGSADGSIGIVKGGLTLISVAALTARAILLNTTLPWFPVFLLAVLAGIVSVALLSWFFRWLLRNQEDGNWTLADAEGKVGQVYVPIPPEGEGRITIEINDTNREVTAKAKNGMSLETNRKVLVVDSQEDLVWVIPYDEN